ncbi:hypothetical protein BKA62DRAFT_797407 [Auriculariales sp. MPI-PUGE-AT-0066]|nr:hypothetical protein BKA62DRAFT_797407 [Auriculariales sp. MPI-PUGE-AT-0066]
MTRHWEAGVQYNNGDAVEYHGKKYNIIQPHRSQSDWAPDRTPALWGVVPYHDCDDDFKDKHKEKAHDEGNQCRPAHEWNPPAPTKQRPDQAPYQTEPVKPEEQKKNWYDLSDERKKQLAIGGGLAAGIGLLGAGFAAYKHHEHDEEKKTAYTWGAQNWLKDAQECTQRFYQQGPTGPCTWLLVNGNQIPQGAIVGGEEGGNTLYVARSYHEGGVHPGKAGACSIIGYGNDEVDYDTYEVLVGDMRGLRWVDAENHLDLSRLGGARPVDGGREGNGDRIYIAQGQYKGNTICGKVKDTGKDHGALLPQNDKEHTVERYRVLCYA